MSFLISTIPSGYSRSRRSPSVGACSSGDPGTSALDTIPEEDNNSNNHVINSHNNIVRNNNNDNKLANNNFYYSLPRSAISAKVHKCTVCLSLHGLTFFQNDFYGSPLSTSISPLQKSSSQSDIPVSNSCVDNSAFVVGGSLRRKKANRAESLSSLLASNYSNSRNNNNSNNNNRLLSGCLQYNGRKWLSETSLAKNVVVVKECCSCGNKVKGNSLLMSFCEAFSFDDSPFAGQV